MLRDKLTALLQPVLVEMGYMNPGRWQHIGAVYSDLGMLPKNVSLQGFLYDPDPRPDLRWLYLGLAVAALLGAALWLVHTKRLNRERQSAQERIEAAEKLYEAVGMLDMALRDGLPLSEAWSGAFGADIYGAMARYRDTRPATEATKEGDNG